MYRFAADIDLSALVGGEVTQICMGPGDVQFRFHSDACIAVQSKVELLEASQPIAEWNLQSYWSSLAFQKLMNAAVQGYKVLDEKRLEIQFSRNYQLRLHDDSAQFESLQIYLPGDSLGPIVI